MFLIISSNWYLLRILKDISICNVVLQSRANVYMKNRGGFTALHLCCQVSFTFYKCAKKVRLFTNNAERKFDEMFPHFQFLGRQASAGSLSGSWRWPRCQPDLTKSETPPPLANIKMTKTPPTFNLIETISAEMPVCVCLANISGQTSICDTSVPACIINLINLEFDKYRYFGPPALGSCC